jgi:hypothetical protein
MKLLGTFGSNFYVALLASYLNLTLLAKLLDCALLESALVLEGFEELNVEYENKRQPKSTATLFIIYYNFN